MCVGSCTWTYGTAIPLRKVDAMDRRAWIVAAYAVVSITLGTVSVGCGQEETATPVLTSVTPQELRRLLEAHADIVVLDVRSQEEHAAGHIPGAVNIPHTEIASRLGELSAYRNKHVIVCCWAGGRAAIAKEVLRNAGFTSLLDLQGHMAEWERLGYPLERTANE
jgi:rhodanese-related sulfurtransferase